MRYSGVKFYSVHDWSCGTYLEQAEAIIRSFDDNIEYDDINKVIELYNINLYFINNCLLERWTDIEKEYYKGIANKFNKNIGIFFSLINEDNITEQINKVAIDYYDDFWILFDKYNVNERISPESFEKNLNSIKTNFSSILVHKKIVKYYEKVLVDFLNQYVGTAEILFEEYLLKKENDNRYYFPDSLNKGKRQINIRI